MKKLVFTLFLFVSTINTFFAQNAYHDALFLVEARPDIIKYRDSMAYYMPKYVTKLSQEEKRTAIELRNLILFINNPYIDSIPLPRIEEAKSTLRAMPELLRKMQEWDGIVPLRGQENGPKAYNKAGMRQLSNLSGASLTEIPSSSLLSASQIIDGTALFIKRRVREELKMAFLDQFKSRLDSNTLMRYLLPATYRTLQSVAEMDNQMPSLNNVALNAFQADMEQLPEHIEAALLYDKEFEELRHDRNFKYFALPFNTIKHFQLGSHPAFALQDLREKYFTDNSELDRIIQMMVVLNDNLRATEAESINTENNSKITFIENEKWQSLRKQGGDSLFMALIYRQHKKTIFAPMADEPLAEVRHNMHILGDNISDYLGNLNAFDTYHSTLRDISNRNERDSLALQLTWNVMQLIDKSHLIYFSMLDKNRQMQYRDSYWQQYKPIAEATLKATASLQKRNYAGVVLNSFQILRGMSNIESLKKRNLFQNDFLQLFFFYGNFMTDVLTAYNSEEVSEILDRYAAPVGSYSLKRKSKFSISLNAYPGLFVAFESPLGKKSYSGLSKNSFVSGITAPIGLSFNWGVKGKNHNKKPSASIFVSAIDIGAVLSYRWANDSAEGLPNDVEWAQVLSPGVHLMYGIAGLPLTLSAGYQLSPKLRQVTIDNNKIENRNFQRFTMSIMTDITIFNFYKTPKRNK